MEIPNFNTNIEMEDIMSQLREEQEKKLASASFAKKSDYNPKRYLQASLKKDEDSKQIVIRLLPFSPNGGSPFHKVHMHTVKVNTEVSPSGWKTISCPSLNPESQEGNKECPFCNTAKAAREIAKTTLDEAKKKRLNDIAFANRASEMWVIRCIERGAEEDGVKFWLIPNPKNGGIYQTIMNIYNTRKEAGERRGEVRNIFDLSHGKDLIVTIKRGPDGKRKIDIVDDDDFSPLTTNVELGNSWINDETKWTDLYPFKRVDYMTILAENGVPYYDKETNTYINKEDAMAKAQTAKEAQAAEQAAQVTEYPVDYSIPTPIEETKPVSAVSSKENTSESTLFAVNSDVSSAEMPPQPSWEDDLPF